MQKLTAATVFAELQGKEIALIGLGVSHRPVAKLLAQKGMKGPSTIRRARRSWAKQQKS